MRKEIMVKAHKIAKAIVAEVGEYVIALSIGLKQAWKEFKEGVEKEITGVSEKQIKYAKDLLRQSMDFLVASPERYEKVMATINEENIKRIMKHEGWSRNKVIVEGLKNFSVHGYYVRENITDAAEIIDLLK